MLDRHSLARTRTTALIGIPPTVTPGAAELFEVESKLLSGFRGSQAVDVDALAGMMCRLSELGADLVGEINEIDVNPIIIGVHGGVAVDALVVRRTAGAEEQP